MARGHFFTVRQIREALFARHADTNDQGSVRFEGTPPIIFLGIMADDNEAIVTEECVYFVDGEPHKLLNALPHDPFNEFTVIA
jgi:hypothetical protein